MSGASGPTSTAEELRELREKFEEMPLVLFEEVVFINVRENNNLLRQVSKLLDGKSLVDMTMWFVSFVVTGAKEDAAWCEEGPGDPVPEGR